MVLDGSGICLPDRPLAGDRELGRHPLVRPVLNAAKVVTYHCLACGQSFELKV